MRGQTWIIFDETRDLAAKSIHVRQALHVASIDQGRKELVLS